MEIVPEGIALIKEENSQPMYSNSNLLDILECNEDDMGSILNVM